MIKLPNGESTLSLGDLRAFISQHPHLSDNLPVDITLPSRNDDDYAYVAKVEHHAKSAISYEAVNLTCGKSWCC